MCNNMALRNIIISNIFLTLLIISCSNEQEKSSNSELNFDTIIKVDSTYSKSSFDQIVDLKYPNDTVLRSGWSVRYYVNNDSTKDKDLYINCEKNGRRHIYKSEDVLLLRSYFIPTFIGESNNCIYFRTACATNCRSILVFSKKYRYSYKLYNSIVSYSIKDDILVHIPENNIGEHKYFVSIINFKNRQVKTVRFKYHCNVLPEEGCIDSVNIVGNRVKLFSTLNKGTDYKQQVIKEIKTVVF
jgi:hypothetical protein